MKLSGNYKLDLKKEAVWKALNDPNILQQCIPGCESFQKKDDTHFIVTATNQIGPMNATFSGEVNLSDIKENESYTLSGEAQSSVGFANGSAVVKLIEENESTTLTYEVNVDVGGKIAQLGSRLINGVAKKMSDYFFGRFADLIAPITKKSKLKESSSSKKGNDFEEIEDKRVKELKSDFLNKYIYGGLAILILLIVVIFYFVSR